jgi:hypothetical protein
MTARVAKLRAAPSCAARMVATERRGDWVRVGAPALIGSMHASLLRHF